MGELDINNDAEIPDNTDSLLDEEGVLKDNIYSDLVLELLEKRNSLK